MKVIDSYQMMLFPTLVNTFYFGESEEIKTAKEYLLAEEKHPKYLNKDNFNQTRNIFCTEDNLHTVKEMEPITNAIKDCFTESLTRMGHDFYGIDVPCMWANIASEKTIGPHQQHLHPNSYLSCVFYISIPADNGELKFIDPVNARNMTRFPYLKTAPNTAYSAWSFKPTVGMCIVFPSWLQHSVDNGYWSGDERRIAVSANCIPLTKIDSPTMKFNYQGA